MGIGIFDVVKRTASLMGQCDPLWYRNHEEPSFETVEVGSHGAPMILLHGLFGALSNWDSVQPLFGSFCQSIALSFPLLTAHRSEVKIKSLALYTEYLLRQRFTEPVVLCGNSLGGHVALRLCLASPQLVDCLVLSGASGLYEHTVDALPVRPDARFVREHMHRVFHNDKFVTEEAIQEIVQILADRMRVLNLIHAARSAKRDYLERLLPQIKVPTLLLWGEDDEITTLDVARTFHRQIPNSKLVTVKNCGHAPMIEHPEWFATEVEGFLRENSRWYKNPPKSSE
jgi:2-hydroxy-6-oxonona-2,4-dienedioate hydrolase